MDVRRVWGGTGGETHVIVDGITHSTSNDTDGESESGDGSDKIVWADNGCDDGSWDDDSTDAEAADDEDDP